jgi:hypothetical protein
MAPRVQSVHDGLNERLIARIVATVPSEQNDAIARFEHCSFTN